MNPDAGKSKDQFQFYSSCLKYVTAIKLEISLFTITVKNLYRFFPQISLLVRNLQHFNLTFWMEKGSNPLCSNSNSPFECDSHL